MSDNAEERDKGVERELLGLGLGVWRKPFMEAEV